MSYTAITLDQIAAPDVVEALDFETILAGMIADLIERAPELAAVLELESDPLSKLLEVCAYREMVIRARVNDAARAVMLATAGGADLENLAALLGVERLTVIPADPDAIPPVVAVMEDDASLRLRTQLALEGFSSAGPRGAYEFHARSASAEVLDVSVISPFPGDVLVTLLARTAPGTASAELIGLVAEALNDERIRPLCDSVTIQSASLVPFEIEATIQMDAGPDTNVVMAAAQTALDDYLANGRRIGRPVTRSGIFAALHRPGVARVTLTSPAADIEVAATAVGNCTAITLIDGGTV